MLEQAYDESTHRQAAEILEKRVEQERAKTSQRKQKERANEAVVAQQIRDKCKRRYSDLVEERRTD